MLNLSVWFAIHTVFRHATPHDSGPLHVEVPDLSTLDPAALRLAVASLLAMLRFKLGLGWTLLSASLAGAAVVWLRTAA